MAPLFAYLDCMRNLIAALLTTTTTRSGGPWDRRMR
jgi:hypothetical protein